jgi:RimJ/RimL family protein N-acetyltransferase
VGYTLGREHWGQGFAREGAAVALAYAWRECNRQDVISLIRPANTASIRVAESLGAVQTGETEFFGGPTRIYSYRRPIDSPLDFSGHC